jgi:predicted TIM-barrel fold metal-dependent hydrolase
VIIDIHAHIGNINQALFWAADDQTLERYAIEAGVDLLCVSAAKSIMYDTTEGNLDLDRDLNKTSMLLGYVVVNPMFPETINDLELINKNKKFRGAKIHPDYHGYDMKSQLIQDFLGQVADRVPVMLFHVSCMPGTGFAAATQILRFAKHNPGTKIIMAHMAGIFQNALYPYFPNFEGLEAVKAAALDNVYVDTAHHLMYVYPGVMQRMVDLIGPDHIVYGTDVPLQGPKQMRFAIETILSLNIPEKDKEKILYGNAKLLLGL